MFLTVECNIFIGLLPTRRDLVLLSFTLPGVNIYLFSHFKSISLKMYTRTRTRVKRPFVRTTKKCLFVTNLISPFRADNAPSVARQISQSQQNCTVADEEGKASCLLLKLYQPSSPSIIDQLQPGVSLVRPVIINSQVKHFVTPSSVFYKYFEPNLSETVLLA